MILKILTFIAFLMMLAVNVLADTLPINGVTTGEVSDAYPTLFTPAGYTFAIWGLIYALLGAFSLYQLRPFNSGGSAGGVEPLQKIRIYFIISSLANILWLFAWHNGDMPLTFFLIVIMLLCLIWISQILAGEALTPTEKLFIRLPLSVYFGWITVACAANLAVLLVSAGWDGFGLPPTVWTVVLMIAVVLIGIAVMTKNRDVAYGFVLLWAFAGILVKHTAMSGFDGEYPAVVITAVISLVLIAAGIFIQFFPQRRADR